MFPDARDYDIQESLTMQVSPIFFNRVISRAERQNLAVILCHSHPFAKDHVEYSMSDDYGEQTSAQTLYDCLYQRPMGSILFGKNCVIGRIWESPGRAPLPVSQVRILGRHLTFIQTKNPNQDDTLLDQIYSRQVLAFGKKGQRFLSDLNIGIVGVGGTGSSVAEQLARIGIRKFLLVDHDIFEPSNITRVYGSSTADVDSEVQTLKVNIIKNNIKCIRPDANIVVYPMNVIDQRVLKALTDCDVVFSCTDRHAPRAVLNELAYQYFIPVIDMGAGLLSKGGKIVNGSVRVSIVGPDLPCMFCQGFVRSEVITAEMLPESERRKRLREGYIVGLDDSAPSVISFTTLASSLSITLLLDMLFDYMNNNSPTVLIEINPLRMSTLAGSQCKDCVCGLRLGRGNSMPFSAP